MAGMMNYATARILYLIPRCSDPSHVSQILTQLIVHNLTADTTFAAAFISYCRKHNLLTSAAFPLFINNHTRPHTFVCNTLLRAFSHSDAPQTSPIIYSHMHTNSIPANHYTFPFVLKAAADLKLIQGGQSVHAQIIRLGFLSDLYVGNSLVNLYAVAADFEMCLKVFDEMPVRDVVSWTVVISGFKDSGRFDDALSAFDRMRNEGVMPNQVTAVNALAACAGSGALDTGVWLHDYVKRKEWELDVILGTSLIEMYGRCGRIEEGLCVFEEMSEKNVYTWNAVIRGQALSKNAKEALRWFLRMEREGIQPNAATLTVVLSACVHIGDVEMGQRIFSSLVDGKYGVPPSVEHYNCMIDLLARAKLFNEACRLINEMPFEPSVSSWGALAAACRAHGANELAEFAAWKLVELQPEVSAYYVALSNVYAENGRWNDAMRVRELMADRGLKKDMGCSLVEVQNSKHPLVLEA
ncbi:pentatricopeptide repeat-containing protein At5g66520-like [Salvia hispanica]|uniref:pentatricopeptide repeat-containing protein At5g66520-like n=1 Tax=Salvia hispanica TaxID=49212 RepID=UPI00200948EC|nr:pentatricopeptide repeat-containing protein At5g66520-like [Salvia hispanica]